jgi:hypothetical protein
MFIPACKSNQLYFEEGYNITLSLITSEWLDGVNDSLIIVLSSIVKLAIWFWNQNFLINNLLSNHKLHEILTILCC